jgi:hypothetical protein
LLGEKNCQGLIPEQGVKKKEKEKERNKRKKKKS